MLRRQKSEDNRPDEMDEHNQPTEPMPPLVLPAFPASVPGVGPSGVSSIEATLPVAPDQSVPPTYGAYSATPYSAVQDHQFPYPYIAPEQQPYPVLPPRPVQNSPTTVGGNQDTGGGEVWGIILWIVYTYR